MRLCANSPIITRFSRDDVPRELLWWGIGRQKKKKENSKRRMCRRCDLCKIQSSDDSGSDPRLVRTLRYSRIERSNQLCDWSCPKGASKMTPLVSCQLHPITPSVITRGWCGGVGGGGIRHCSGNQECEGALSWLGEKRRRGVGNWMRAQQLMAAVIFLTALEVWHPLTLLECAKPCMTSRFAFRIRQLLCHVLSLSFPLYNQTD